MKIRVGVFFGGKSVEHEVSVISGLQAYNSFDKEKYDLVAVQNRNIVILKNRLHHIFIHGDRRRHHIASRKRDPIYITKDNELYTGELIADIANYRNIPELLPPSVLPGLSPL